MVRNADWLHLAVTRFGVKNKQTKDESENFMNVNMEVDRNETTT